MLARAFLNRWWFLMEITCGGRRFHSSDVCGKNDWKKVSVLQKGIQTFCAWSKLDETYREIGLFMNEDLANQKSHKNERCEHFNTVSSELIVCWSARITLHFQTTPKLSSVSFEKIFCTKIAKSHENTLKSIKSHWHTGAAVSKFKKRNIGLASSHLFPSNKYTMLKEYYNCLNWYSVALNLVFL